RLEHLIKKIPDIVTGEKVAHGSVWQGESAPQMENGESLACSHEEACARVAKRFAPRWLRFYVGGKLRSDPVFASAYEILSVAPAPLLDVGCGVGLLPFYLRERGLAGTMTGIDIDGRKVQRGHAIAQACYRDVSLREMDAAHDEMSAFRGNIALFDLLHYVPAEAQRRLLERLAQCVPEGGLVLIREAPRDRSARFRMTYLGEVFAQTISWNVGGGLHFPRRAELAAAFPASEWTLTEQPTWGRTPFNNRLFIFRRRAL
ncbi:MAG: class I SAM-dependent methyltransferase, partial [Chthoniobacterales bacterium]